MTAPGAARLAPDVDGLQDALAIFYSFPDKPSDWDHEVSPAAAAELRQRSITVGCERLQALLKTNPDMEAQNRYILAQLYAFQGLDGPRHRAVESLFPSRRGV